MIDRRIDAPAIATTMPVLRRGEGQDAPVLLPGLPARWSCDLRDDSLRWDAGVFDLFGLPRDRTLDRRAIVEMYTDHSREMLHRLRSAAIAGAWSFTFEARILRPDGAYRWMRVVADTVVSNGRVTHLYGTKRDISDEVAGGSGLR